ncbi:MAG: ABC transporter substrate-binding protein [Desulfomonilaceae bacterium]
MSTTEAALELIQRRDVKWLLLSFAVCLFVIGLVASCGYYSSAETYRIGVCVRKGDGTKVGQDLTQEDKDLEDLTVKALEINKKLLEKKYRRKIELVYGDSEKHKEERVLAVIGRLFSQKVKSEIPTYEKDGIVYITPSASDPLVTKDKRWVFSMMYNDHQQAGMIANFLKYVLKCESVVVVYMTNRYGQTLEEGFRASLFPDKYYKIPFDSSKEPFPDFVEKTFKPRLKEANPDAIVLFTYPKRGKQMIDEIRKLHRGDGKKPIPIICPESFYKEKDFPNPSYGSNIYVATPFVKEFGTEEANRLRHEFKKVYPGKSLTLYPFLACEAMDLVLQAASGSEEQIKRDNNKLRNVDALIDRRKKIREFFDHMRSPDEAKVGMSGPLFFEDHSIHRPVVIALVNDKIVRPMSVQIQETAPKGAGQKYISEMEKKGRVLKEDAKEGEKYFKLVPVVYTSMMLGQLTNFDVERKTMDVYYRVCFTWPHAVYPEHSWLNVESIGLVHPEVVSKSETWPVIDGYRYYPGYPEDRLHSHKCYDRKVTVHWDPPVSLFPFDVQRMTIRLRSYGQNANEIVLALDEETLPKDGKESEPHTDDQFKFIQCPPYPDSDSTYLDRETSKLIDPITGLNSYYYMSVYEKQFTLTRIPSLIPILVLLLPLALVSIWFRFWRTGTPLPVGTVPGGIAITLFLALHGWCVTQYKILPWSPLNTSFLVCYIIILGSWIGVQKHRSNKRGIRKLLNIACAVILTAYSAYVLYAIVQWAMASECVSGFAPFFYR